VCLPCVCVQIPLHLGLLLPLRLNPSWSESFVTTVGKGNAVRGIKRYYRLIVHCNIGISIVSPWILYMIRELYACQAAAPAPVQALLQPALWAEIGSVGILGAVLGARLFGIVTHQTKKLFGLPWTTQLPPKDAAAAVAADADKAAHTD
jgi:hypothetical protein